MTFYVTSDLHFGHNNICGPEGFVDTRKHFESTADMNEAIIEAWNSVVTVEDTVYHLGDLSMNLSRQDLLKLIERLNGKLILIKGNHDSNKLLNWLEEHADGKIEVKRMGDIVKRNKVSYLLTHYPQGIGERSRRIRNLCGHIHDQVADEANVLNVGVDSPEINSVKFGTPLKLDDAMDLVDEKHEKYLRNFRRN